jgi:hypothetical protein
MKQEFVPYELASKLKQLGFDEPCFATYNVDKKLSRNPSHDMEDLPIEGQPYYWNNSKIHKDNVAAPIFQQAFRWFREEHDLHYQLVPFFSDKESHAVDHYLAIAQHRPPIEVNTFEEAELAALDKLIEIVELKNKDNGL